MQEESTETVWAAMIIKYLETFDAGPPLIGLNQEEALIKMQEAIETGIPITVPESPDFS